MSERIELINRQIGDREEKITKKEEAASIDESSIKNEVELEFNEKIEATKANLEKEIDLLNEAKEKYGQWKVTFADKKVYVKTLRNALNALNKKKSNTLNTKLTLILDEKEKNIKDFQKDIKKLQKQKEKLEKALEKELSKL